MSIEEKVQKIVCEQLGVSAEEVKLEASYITGQIIHINGGLYM